MLFRAPLGGCLSTQSRAALVTHPKSHLIPERGGWCTCPWGRSIIRQTLPHAGVIAENITAVTWNQALSSHRGFYLFPCEAAPAAGRIKVVCVHFAAKWPYLMAAIPKALTAAAAFSLSQPEHVRAGCRVSDVVVSVIPTEKPSLWLAVMPWLISAVTRKNVMAL